MRKQKPLNPLLKEEFKMKILQDLGMKKPTENYYKKVRMALFECTMCNKPFEAVVSTKSKNQLYCKNCNGTCLKKDNRDHPLYRIWADTKSKIKSDKGKRHISYLDKSITMCKEWIDSFESFFEWALPLWKEGTSIDRIDNDGNYEPSNCRFTTMSVQAANTRKLRSNNTSGYRGVFKIHDNLWWVNVRFNYKSYRLGSYKTALEAAKAYDYFILNMNLPNTINGVLSKHEEVLPTNKSSLKILFDYKGIHRSNPMSKEP